MRIDVYRLTWVICSQLYIIQKRLRWKVHQSKWIYCPIDTIQSWGLSPRPWWNLYVVIKTRLLRSLSCLEAAFTRQPTPVSPAGSNVCWQHIPTHGVHLERASTRHVGWTWRLIISICVTGCNSCTKHFKLPNIKKPMEIDSATSTFSSQSNKFSGNTSGGPPWH